MLSVQMAIHLMDIRTEELRQAIEEQLRACKAHLARLDSCSSKAKTYEAHRNEASIYRVVSDVHALLCL